LGHGFLANMKYKVTDALVACDGFGGAELRRECHDGVFMENTVHGLGMPSMDVGDSASTAPHARDDARRADARNVSGIGPRVSMRQRGGALSAAVWGYQPLVIAKLTSYDYAKTLAGCGQAPPASSDIATGRGEAEHRVVRLQPCARCVDVRDGGFA
jgi:hypothetical protein